MSVRSVPLSILLCPSSSTTPSPPALAPTPHDSRPARVRHRSIAFAGDSLSQQQFLSLLCLLTPTPRFIPLPSPPPPHLPVLSPSSPLFQPSNLNQPRSLNPDPSQPDTLNSAPGAAQAPEAAAAGAAEAAAAGAAEGAAAGAAEGAAEGAAAGAAAGAVEVVAVGHLFGLSWARRPVAGTERGGAFWFPHANLAVLQRTANWLVHVERVVAGGQAGESSRGNEGGGESSTRATTGPTTASSDTSSPFKRPPPPAQPCSQPANRKTPRCMADAAVSGTAPSSDPPRMALGPPPLVLLRTLSPAHFAAGTWSTGGRCDGFQDPLRGEEACALSGQCRDTAAEDALRAAAGVGRASAADGADGAGAEQAGAELVPSAGDEGLGEATALSGLRAAAEGASGHSVTWLRLMKVSLLSALRADAHVASFYTYRTAPKQKHRGFGTEGAEGFSQFDTVTKRSGPVPSAGLETAAFNVTGQEALGDMRENTMPGDGVKTLVRDCVHWCLPGVPDTWNELLYAELIRSGNFTLK
ncbi:unnamed protein product [Closterium sp. Naga37s-1]|nr:unnamed protein product [Closterium sp. Naga37s-1]